MRGWLLYGALPYLALLSLLAVPMARALLPREPPRPVPLTPRERALSWAWRWGLALLIAGHLVAFVLPQAVAWINRRPAGLVLSEGIGLACAGLALGGLLALAAEALRAWRALRELRALERRGGAVLQADPSGAAALPQPLPPSAADTLFFSFLLLAVGSGLVVMVRHSGGASWYADTLLPYVRSLIRLRPDLPSMIEMPFAVRLHTVTGFLAAALFPWSRGGLLLALPWLSLRRRSRSSLRTVPPAGERRLPLRLKLALAAFVLLLGALGLGVADLLHRVGSSQGYAPPQPIAFSHRLHAGVNQIPCLYCHFAAERSRHAGIPALNVCMNCHRQIRKASAELEKLKEAVLQGRPIRWVKIHNLPDFVYFNHSQHVAVAGLACRRCHGAVETMERVDQEAPLTMGWCIGCHRSEEVVPAGQPRAVIASLFGAPPPKDRPARRGMGGQDCSKCHY